MKFLFAFALLLSSLFAAAQRTVELTADLVLTETMLIDEDVTYVGNGFKMSCTDCSPAIQVTNGATVRFRNVVFTRGFKRWMAVGNGSAVYWESPRMKGSIVQRGQKNKLAK